MGRAEGHGLSAGGSPQGRASAGPHADPPVTSPKGAPNGRPDTYTQTLRADRDTDYRTESSLKTLPGRYRDSQVTGKETDTQGHCVNVTGRTSVRDEKP